MNMTALRTCPICGSKRITRVAKTLSLPTPRDSVEVSDVSVDQCKNCGEEFLDIDASRKIDATVFSSRRAPRRRKTA
jgi:YgiT-type zinc finger domain-containing protein